MGWGLTKAAQSLLAQVQQLFGADKVVVTSGQGSRVGVAGGSATSQHPSGNAFDFHVTGMTPAQVQTAIANSPLSFGQSIQEYGAAAGAGLNHLGVGTKRQLLRGDNGRYTVLGTAPTPATVPAPGRAWLQGIFGQTFGNIFADIPSALGIGLSAPGNAIEGMPVIGDLYGVEKAIVNGEPLVDFNGWFGRIALGILAILLIGVALFMLAGKPAIEIAGKLPRVPV